MKDGKQLEKKLYEESNETSSVSDLKRSGGLKEYTKMTSVLGGLFFSGVGYTVAATGSLIKDLVTYLYSELPRLSYQISDGISHNLPNYFSELMSSSLAHANQIGGIGAAVGMVGGTVLMGKLRTSILSIFGR